jgi:hypothetical protein
MKYIILLLLMLASPALAANTSPPYSWPAEKCERVKEENGSVRCYWRIVNSEATHACVDTWKISSDAKWRQEGQMTCVVIDELRKARILP